MLSAVALPAVAEEAPDDAVSVLNATAETGADGIAQNYTISSWEELFYASNNPTFFGTEAVYAERGLAGVDTIYLTTDLDVYEYEGGVAKFQSDFTNFNGNNAMIFNGLGHTIYSYQDTMPFFHGRFSGKLCNISFLDAKVTLEEAYGAAILYSTEHGMIVDNVHLLSSTVSGTNSNIMGGIFAYSQSQDRKDMTFTNCSVVGTKLIDTGVNNYGMGLIAGRLRGATYVLKNILVANNTITGAGGASSETSAFVVGNLYGVETNGSATFDTIGVYGNKMTAASTAVNLGIVAANRSKTTVKASDIYAADNSGTVSTLFYDLAGTSSYTVGDYEVDETVANVVYGKNSATSTVAVNAANTSTTFNMNALLSELNSNENYNDWGYDILGELTLLDKGENAPLTVTIESGNGCYKAGETVTLTAELTDVIEPAYLEVRVDYDSAHLLNPVIKIGDLNLLEAPEDIVLGNPIYATFYNPDGVNYVGGTLLTVSFTVAEGSENGVTPVVITLTDASAYVFDPADPTVATDVTACLLANASVTSNVTIGDFTPGDVNNDKKVNILDAALLLQKLNGNIHYTQDATFNLFSANVQNSGTDLNEVNTADLARLLSYISGNCADLDASYDAPTFVEIK